MGLSSEYPPIDHPHVAIRGWQLRGQEMSSQALLLH